MSSESGQVAGAFTAISGALQNAVHAASAAEDPFTTLSENIGIIRATVDQMAQQVPAALATTVLEPAVEPLACTFCVIDLKDAERRGIPEQERLPVHTARVVANGMGMCDVRHMIQPPPVSNGFVLPGHGNGGQLPPLN